MDTCLRFGVLTAQVDVSWETMVERWQYGDQFEEDVRPTLTKPV